MSNELLGAPHRSGPHIHQAFGGKLRRSKGRGGGGGDEAAGRIADEDVSNAALS